MKGKEKFLLLLSQHHLWLTTSYLNVFYTFLSSPTFCPLGDQSPISQKLLKGNTWHFQKKKIYKEQEYLMHGSKTRWSTIWKNIEMMTFCILAKKIKVSKDFFFQKIIEATSFIEYLLWALLGEYIQRKMQENIN